MHYGDNDSGHYTAFIKPTKDSSWFKFDDDRVTHVTLHDAIESNFGGGEKGIAKHSSAYMLVYYRESDLDMILCDVGEVPQHLGNPESINLNF